MGRATSLRAHKLGQLLKLLKEDRMIEDSDLTSATSTMHAPLSSVADITAPLPQLLLLLLLLLLQLPPPSRARHHLTG
eukprot:COSAG06_NODE_9617_length_1854_cov_1.196703_2_plen_78_part_00